MDAQKWYEEQEKSLLEEYFELLKFQSISADPTCIQDLKTCCNWVEKKLSQSGFQVQKFKEETATPVLIANKPSKDPDALTVMIYHHYDVQPADPLDLWDSPPFEPTIRNGQVYARGAQDNKGQLFYTLAALKYLKDKDLFVNLKILVEGQEEMGSEVLEALIEERKDLFEADAILVVDAGIPSMQEPAVGLGARGICTMQVKLQTAQSDLHSGEHGGLALSATKELSKILASCFDEKGHLIIPGLFEDVDPLTVHEKQVLEEALLNLKEYKDSMQVYTLDAQASIKHNWLDPVLEVNGMWGGYTGAKFKTVLPCEAYAKISCRLVTSQDPIKVYHQIVNHLAQNLSEGTKLTAEYLGGGKASKTSVESFLVQLVTKAYCEVFHKECKHVYMGGSIPIAAKLADSTGADVVFMGMGLATDAIHAPNEHFGIDRLKMGFLILANLLQNRFHNER